MEWRVVNGAGEEFREDEEEEIERQELRRVIRKMKDRKALGGNNIPNEVWKYGGEEVEEWILDLCRRVWRGEGSKNWRGHIVKRGEGEKVEEYRDITIAQSAYKIYTMILANRLKGRS